MNEFYDMKKFLYALRVLFRFKSYTVINIIGLILSVAATLVIVRYVHQELTVDHFCKHLDQVYHLTLTRSNGEISLYENTNLNNDPDYRDPLKHAEVEFSSYCIPLDDDYILLGEQRFRLNVLVADSSFLKIMPYPVLSGIHNITSPNDAIITQDLAHRLFGSVDPLGKQFVSSTGKTLTIRGIIGNPSTKASINFDMITPTFQDNENQWSRIGICLVKLARGTDLDKYNQKISQSQALSYFENEPISYQLCSLRDFYFNKKIETFSSLMLRGNHTQLIILIIVAGMLLLVGLLNFINIYTVVILKRAREFGIKKVYGASKYQIFMQIYIENLCITAIALFLIWGLVESTSGLCSNVFDIPVKGNVMFDGIVSLFILLGLPLIITIYPFLKYSYSSSITSLHSINVGGNSIVSRIGFLFIQYIITFSLVVIALFFVRQLYTMLNADLGYKTKDIISCEFLNYDVYNRSYSTHEEWEKSAKEFRQKKQMIQQKMNACPLFISWNYNGDLPIQLEPYMNFTYNQEKHKMAIISASDTYMKIFGFQLKEGRVWNYKDRFSQYKLIINETAQKMFGITDISKAFLQPERRIWYSRGIDVGKNPPFEVVGVIKDFRSGHLSKKNIPLAIFYEDGMNAEERMLASIVPGKKKEAVAFLKKLHDEVIGEGDFIYSFVEDEVAKIYKEDQRTTRIYMAFACLAIFISCMGLFGLSLYDIRQRYREIALRKVNGASDRQIIFLLMRKYLYILGLSFIIAIPVVYYIIYDYTKNFEVKTPIGIDIFIIGLLLTTFISMGTLLWQVHQALRINPASVMKNE